MEMHRSGVWLPVTPMSSGDCIQNKQFIQGTLGQVGAEPGIGRALFGRPSARQASANRGINAGSHSADDTLGVLDEAFGSNQGTGLLGKIVGSGRGGSERRLRDTAWSRYWRG